MYGEIFIIIYPGGDKTRLKVASISSSCLEEKMEYSLASRRDFHDEQIATDYGKMLAKENGLIFEGDCSNRHAYLD